MATVYDVVQIVAPGAQTSTPAGRWHVMFFSKKVWEGNEANPERDAESLAERCRSCATVPGIDYRVETHDELCPGRAKMPRETHEVGKCTCRNAPATA